MNVKVMGKVIGILLMCFSLSMLTPLIVAAYFHNAQFSPYIISFIVTMVVGFFLWLLTSKTSRELRTKDGFLIVVLIWVVLPLFGSLPFMLVSGVHLSFTDAFFETLSGLTTTGATTILHIDVLPQSLIYYRQQLQFIGGMGIIVLGVAILPLIGVGGMQLFRAESSGPLKDNKLTPHITSTAKALWAVYLGMTVLCIFSYWFMGMPIFDAINYAFSTVSTGGYAPHDLSLAYYPSDAIYCVAMVFMFLGAVNFSLHFVTLKRRQLKHYWHNVEFRAFIWILLVLMVVIVATLFIQRDFHEKGRSLMSGIFQTVSFLTTTGFTTTDYFQWPLFLPILLMFVGMLGACSGSTTGGIKIIRAVLLRKQIGLEVNKLIHPNGVFPVKVGSKIIPEKAMNSIWAFISAYLLIFILFWLLIMATGLNPRASFSAVAACLSNAGPGLDVVSSNYGNIPAVTRWLLSVLMLLGRLEVFTVLVLLSPNFWRH